MTVKSSKEVITAFLEDLDKEELDLYDFIHQHDYRFILQGAVRELDFHHVMMRAAQSPTAGQKAASTLLNFGIPLVLRLIFLKIKKVRKYATLTKTNETLDCFFGALLYRAGGIENGRRLAHLALDGICTIEKPQAHHYEIAFDEHKQDLDSYERNLAENMLHQAAEKYSLPPASHIQLRKNFKIEELLAQHTFVWKDHFIGYGADIILDEYFFLVAYEYAYTFPGFDAFHFSIEFGGVTFQKYRLAVICLIAQAIKHEAHCATLVKLNRDVRYENILTVSTSTQELIDSLIGGINYFGKRLEHFLPITRSEVWTILKVLTASSDNLSAMKGTGSPTPYLINYTTTSVLRCLTAAHHAPFHFLLKSLRQNFPDDYDKNQTTRENAMSTATRRILLRALPKLEFREGTKIRRDGQVVTDLDLVAWNPEEAALLLFQLKYQDSYGSDMKRRRNVRDRLVKEIQKWHNTVNGWIENSSIEQIKSTFHLKKEVNLKKENIFQVVLAKNHAHFISKCALAEHTTYVTWFQLCKIIDELRSSEEKSIQKLTSLLKNNLAPVQAKKIGSQDTVVLTLKNITYLVKSQPQEN